MSPGITIIGANDGDVINLGPGADTVTLGNGETVNGGAGTDIYNVTRTTIANTTIKGGSGSNTLVVTGGGNAKMGSGITGINNVQLATTTKFTANSTAGLQISGSSTGGDTITLGAATQSVIGGGPNETVNTSSVNAGASVSGLGANSTLDITGGGTITLNTNTDVNTVKLTAASTLMLNGMAFITADGSTAKDSIQAGGIDQTLTGGGGADTLIGFSGGSDIFKDTAAHLNGILISDFVNTDTIDLTNMAFNNTEMVTAAASGANTSVTVTLGGTKSTFKIAGSWSSAGFGLASDGFQPALSSRTRRETLLMCGIVGVIGSQQAAPVILGSLRRLEYRGYDSAGIATLVNGHIERRRAEGKLSNLASALARSPLAGSTGIGHTRWATHGAPTERNAHPHATSRVSVVHNGIIENHARLRAELEAAGQTFSTETDTETVAQLVDLNLQCGMDPVEAARSAFSRLEGAYALAMIFSGYPELIIVAQNGAPLAIGFSDDEMFVGSDGLVLAPLTQRVAYLSDGDWAVVDRSGAHVYGADGARVQREVRRTRLMGSAIGKGQFHHFMQKELHEHPAVIGDTLRCMIDPATRAVVLPELPFDFASLPQITVSACGSAFYAGLVGRCWFEAIARIQTDADVASGFRYRTPPLAPGGLGIMVQSGETADTIAALRYMHEQGQHVLSIVNVPESSIARASDVVLETVAGPEVSVASTKAFTAQLSVLACIAIAAGRARGGLSGRGRPDAVAAGCSATRGGGAGSRGADQDTGRTYRTGPRRAVPGARQLFSDRAGRSLKAQGDQLYSRGGLRRRRDEAWAYRANSSQFSSPVIAIAPSGPLFEKTASNLQEAAARSGQVVVISDEAGAAKLRSIAVETIVLPAVDPFVAPIVYAIAVQLLAYHVAVLKGTDVDQPRNLAKSVTVE